MRDEINRELSSSRLLAAFVFSIIGHLFFLYFLFFSEITIKSNHKNIQLKFNLIENSFPGIEKKIGNMPELLPSVNKITYAAYSKQKDNFQEFSSISHISTEENNKIEISQNLDVDISDYYFSEDYLDKPASAIYISPLLYPEDAYLQKISGKVILRIYISQSGSIDSVDILSSDPPGIFEAAALDGVLNTSFSPGRKAGQAVRAVKVIAVTFDPLIDAPH